MSARELCKNIISTASRLGSEKFSMLESHLKSVLEILANSNFGNELNMKFPALNHDLSLALVVDFCSMLYCSIGIGCGC